MLIFHSKNFQFSLSEYEIKFSRIMPIFSKAVGLLKQGWNEIPEVMMSGVFGAIGLVMGAVTCYDYSKNNKMYKRFKDSYTVYRPDDPRVKLIRH